MWAATMERATAETTARPAPETRGTPAHGDRETAAPVVFSQDELVMIAMFADGLCIRTIARRLSMSDRTIRRRSRLMCDRLRASSMIQVVAWAARRRLI